ncbi:MAG: septal ring lytic transglycosylase RlpA family protein [Ottowia sp.]|nr:septal ring lytic transglycosylase RlpA family protein [Ottowia sp.]
MLWIGALYLAASGPLMAQTMGLNASTSLSEPCSSAKAVHDMRCPNYTGFKPRVGGGAAPSAASDDAPGLRVPERPSLGLRGGRDLQRGVASWYGPGFHGRLTANGERFDMNELTAAHKTLPFGTRVLVHNPRTGKEVVVRINDRGPFIKGRMLDLSKAAAKALGFKSRGHDAVVLREVLPARADGELVASGRDS